MHATSTYLLSAPGNVLIILYALKKPFISSSYQESNIFSLFKIRLLFICCQGIKALGFQRDRTQLDAFY